MAVGCRFHMVGVTENRPLGADGYEAIALGEHQRRDVLAQLGPPDHVFYTSVEEVFDYRAAAHRATDLRFFIPTDTFGGVNPTLPLNALRFFFDPFEEPEELRDAPVIRASRASIRGATGFIPFADGTDILVLHGRQLRRDRLRIVFDSGTHIATQKALRLATGEYRHQHLPERAILQAD